MYIPKYFEEKDLNEVEQLIREFGFGMLVTSRNGQPLVTHLPFELEKNGAGEWFLFGHVSRANQQWRELDANPDVLAVFLGPHSYVSPSWYNHKNVPTWNYRAVHAYGKARLVEGEELKNKLRLMMARYENAHAETPMKFDEVPEDLMQKNLNGLVGLSIKIERLDAASKLSQNRDPESFDSIIDHLKMLNKYDSTRVAEEMEKKKKG